MNISITLIIIVVTCITSFISFSNEEMMNKLIFYPPAVNKRNEWYRFFSCGLIHQDIPHLMFNMYALYIFGEGQRKSGVEYTFIEIFGDKGKMLYLLMYVAALAICLVPTYKKNIDNYYYKSLGASGAVSAVVFASILFKPMAGMGLIFLPFFIPGFLFGALYLGISYWMDRKGTGNINHSAHIWGGIFGVLFVFMACRLFADYPVLGYFIRSIREMNAGDLFRTY